MTGTAWELWFLPQMPTWPRVGLGVDVFVSPAPARPRTAHLPVPQLGNRLEGGALLAATPGVVAWKCQA